MRKRSSQKIARDGAGLGIYLMFSALSENGVRYGTLNNIKVKVAGYMYDRQIYPVL